jgi:hypothetical protein
MPVELQRFVCNGRRVLLGVSAVLMAVGMAFPGAQSDTVSQDGSVPPATTRLTVPPGAQSIEQRSPGSKPAPTLVSSFDGLGMGFEGPQGTATLRNPSDNTLAVGRDHVVQIVNSRTAIFTKKGRQFSETGRVLYGPVLTNNVFKGFGGSCEARNNGDAVVRYDQLADRWLIVMPVFGRAATRPDQPPMWQSGLNYLSPPGKADQPGAAALLVPPAAAPAPASPPPRRAAGDPGPTGPYSMCYAISEGPDPLGKYFRYEFLRPLFPDYPRPAIWRDGYYVPTSTGDEVIQKHACVVDRARMLKGQPATEQCAIIDGVNFLNNADIDGRTLPPNGAPNVMIAAGGTQLKGIFEDDRLLVWSFYTNWADPTKTRLDGPHPLSVAPYRYLCDGQLTNCVPQPGTDRRLDAQGDKIMSRVVYRNLGSRESVVATHSVNTSAGAGGVRWYELQIARDRTVRLRQQGTYAPDGAFRWMASPAIDRFGNIAIGFSHGGPTDYAGQRFAARLANDPLGELPLREQTLVAGEDVQAAMRWQDYTQTAMDPDDDCTIWYVGDYIKKGASSYSTKIGAFRLPGCR